MVKNQLLSVIIPMFNEEDNVQELYNELTTVFKQLKYFNCYEIIAVNDGSRDNTLNILKQIAIHDSNLKIISFTRNFGHEQATYAGIQHCHGQALVIIDADGQHPPKIILDFEREFLNGYDIVYGQRIEQLNVSLLKKFTSKVFYPTFKFLTTIDIPKNIGDFCLMSSKVINYLKQISEKTLFIRGLIYWPGFCKKAIPFIQRGRRTGKSKYTYLKLTIFAIENIILFSNIPNYFITFISLFFFIIHFTISATLFFKYLLGYGNISTWLLFIISMLFLFALIFLFIGILGLYIGKILQEIKQRPIFLINEKINLGINNEIKK